MVGLTKKVAIVSNTSWNVYNFRLGLLKALQSQGYKVIVIAPRDEYSKKLLEYGFDFCDVKMNNKGTNPFEDIKLFHNFYKIYKGLSPDIILQYTIKPNVYGSMAAWILKIPVISNISGLGTVFLKDKISYRIARLLYKISLKVPQKVFYQNSNDREILVKSKYVEEKNTDLIPGSGIDTKKFKPFDKTKYQDGVIRFLFIARLLRDKGLLEYAKASKKICNYETAEFYVLGSFYPDNPSAINKDDMKKLEVNYGIKYIGATDDVKSVINEYDCIVLPSYREGMSRVLLEAASMAKPIITTNVPGCKEVVDDGINGYLCRPKNVEDLRKKMEALINLSEIDRKLMGEAGRNKMIKEFDERIVIDKYLKTIREILENHETRSK